MIQPGEIVDEKLAASPEREAEVIDLATARADITKQFPQLGSVAVTEGAQNNGASEVIATQKAEGPSLEERCAQAPVKGGEVLGLRARHKAASANSYNQGVRRVA